jgi:hypothetical protein
MLTAQIAAVEALEPGVDHVTAERAAKMIAALAYMSDEAEAAGHKPLAPDTWEHGLPDGRVLVVVRTGAEASAVLRASKGRETASYETTIPPDLAVTVRQQHEGRQRQQRGQMAGPDRWLEQHHRRLTTRIGIGQPVLWRGHGP